MKLIAHLTGLPKQEGPVGSSKQTHLAPTCQGSNKWKACPGVWEEKDTTKNWRSWNSRVFTTTSFTKRRSRDMLY